MEITAATAFTGKTIHPEKWAESYADYLFCFAMTRVEDGEMAKDLVQDTFLAALEKMDSFEGRSSEKTWLTGILKNKICDVYRRKLKNPSFSFPDPFFRETDGHWLDDQRPGPFVPAIESVMESRELRQTLQGCINKLPVSWLVIFSMKYMDNESSGGICATLKISQSNFWVIIHRAKLHLRACLQKNWK